MKPPFPDGTISSFAPNTPHYFLSNFYPCLGSSSEHLYQAAKTDNPEQKIYVMKQPTAALAKKAGRIVTLKPHWKKIAVDEMYEILKQKFAPGTALERRLWETGDVLLIEGNYWHDIFWGQCYCPKCVWAGDNRLGELLIQVRSEIVRKESWNASKGFSVSS